MPSRQSSTPPPAESPGGRGPAAAGYCFGRGAGGSRLHDSVSKNVFVGTTLRTGIFRQDGRLDDGGRVHQEVAPCLGSASFSFGASSVITDTPIVDSSTGRVFITGRRTGFGTILVQTDTQLSAGSAVTATIGTAGTQAVFSGTPDNSYFTAVSSGKFYVCGVDPSSDAQLFAFGFNSSGVMNPTAVGGRCSWAMPQGRTRAAVQGSQRYSTKPAPQTGFSPDWEDNARAQWQAPQGALCPSTLPADFRRLLAVSWSRPTRLRELLWTTYRTSAHPA